MGISIESKRYPDVVVRIHKDVESGVIMSKTFSIIKNEFQVRDNLAVMCLKHDLQCVDCSKAFGEPLIACSLRAFENIVKMIEHIKVKANKLPYSFKLKGKFAIVTIGEKKYIYRIILKSEKS